MGKIQHAKQTTRPAAQSHTAHKFDSPRHGRTPTGFAVKPAKREVVPIYNVNQRVSFDTSAKQALGAMLLLGTLGSVIKVAQATECVNTRPANPTVTGVTAATSAGITIDCNNSHLFYGLNRPQYEVFSRDGYCPEYYYVSQQRCWDNSDFGWGWSYECATDYFLISRSVSCTVYEQRQTGTLSKMCQDVSGSAQVSDAWGTTDQSRTLGTDDNFEGKCRSVVAQCAQVKSFVCETPTPTPTPTPIVVQSSSSVPVAPTSTATIATSTMTDESSTPIVSPTTTDTPPTSSLADEMTPTPPTPKLIEGGGPNVGGAVAGTLVGLAAAGGLAAGGLVAAKVIHKKKHEGQYSPEQQATPEQQNTPQEQVSAA